MLKFVDDGEGYFNTETECCYLDSYLVGLEVKRIEQCLNGNIEYRGCIFDAALIGLAIISIMDKSGGTTTPEQIRDYVYNVAKCVKERLDVRNKKAN